jgi:hypothetical protein
MPRKVLFASDTSGHTAGYQTVLAGLRDGGFEVVSIGHAEPEHVAETALQEGVDAVAYRVMDRDAAVLGKSLLRELSRRARPAIEAALERVLVLVKETGARGFEPHVYLERAKLAHLTGEEATRQRELREAHRLFTEIGAPIRAEQVAKDLEL